MKNILIMGLAALLFFSVSAGLSLWLNGPVVKADPAAADAKVAPRKVKDKGKSAGDEHEPDMSKPIVRPKPQPGSEEVGQLASKVNDQLSVIRDREARVERRQAQLDLIIQDIRAERGVIDGLRRSATVEIKNLGDKIAELEQKANELEQKRQATSKSATELKSKQGEQEENERQNYGKIGNMYDNMPPENSAKILQQMADMGKMEMAAKTLSQMKERQAAKVLAEISDPAVAAQLLEKMQGLKRPTKSNGAGTGQ